MLGLKLLLTLGVPVVLTRKVALAGVALVTVTPPPVACKFPAGIVLIKLPVRVAVTWTVTVQDPGVPPEAAGIVPPLNDSVADPGFAVTGPAHVVDTLGGFAITIPGWTPAKLSVQRTLVKSNSGFGLKTVTVNVDVPPRPMEKG